tara:strand:+ start:86 stop:382 length:297 start_codon:yes stop_codon:yes gene_type:complete
MISFGMIETEHRENKFLIGNVIFGAVIGFIISGLYLGNAEVKIHNPCTELIEYGTSVARYTLQQDDINYVDKETYDEILKDVSSHILLLDCMNRESSK